MLVMGLDTSLQRCSVAILRDGETLVDKFIGMERGHAEALAPMARSALDEAGLEFSDIGRVGVVVGPGGFTGVRVALSFARGLAVGTAIEVVGITSLAALAASESAPLVAPVIDAKRGQVYGALYDESGDCLVDPFVAVPEQALELLAEKAGKREVALVGSGAGLIAGAPAGWRRSDAPDQISGVIVARLAAASSPPSSPPSPLYLRPPDAKPPKPGIFDRQHP